jgi:hypothetical protein
MKSGMLARTIRKETAGKSMKFMAVGIGVSGRNPIYKSTEKRSNYHNAQITALHSDIWNDT